jgi:2-oxoglutarate/2-oxoacid ferredoxin oxidoreductase subunit alpha
MQARWGSHGDYEIIALCPQSPQESFDLTVDAFNLAETYRVPVLVMMDECVGHMTEKVVIPPADQIEIVPRRLTSKPRAGFKPFEGNGNSVPDFARAGDGYRFHATGLTHDERGYPAMTVAAHEKSVSRLLGKITRNAEAIVRFEEDMTSGADVVVVSYGITARVARMAVELARAEGVKAGSFRLIVAWPFPVTRIRQLAAHARAFVVPEINRGQMVLEVERCARGQADVISVPHLGGSVHDPAVIAEAIVRAANV